MNDTLIPLNDGMPTAAMEEALSLKFNKEEARLWMEKFARPYRTLMTYYNCALLEVETKLRVLNGDFTLDGSTNPIESIKSRIKSPASLLEKIERNGYPMTLDSIEKYINDVAGIRVICSFESDIYRLSEALLRQDDIQLIEMKDYIKHPKPNGYRSLHLILSVPIFLHNEKRIMNVEVQLRTIAMDVWASLEHKLRYKKENLDDVPEFSQELLRCARMTADLDATMEHLRVMKAEHLGK